MTRRSQVLLTGATGFVGRHVHPALLDAGYDVVGATREPARAAREFPDRKYQFFEADDPGSMRQAVRGRTAAVYLLHGMGLRSSHHDDYERAEARTAEAFRRAAEHEGVRRIVYLGGMPPKGRASRHITSRLATGETLRAGSVSTIELRAGMVIGGGSQSWRIVRDLAARLPLMALPRWLNSETQPIAIADVVHAIVHALSLPGEGSQAFALPGPERMATHEVLRRTARLLGSEPTLLRVPMITPRLSSYWIALVTRADPRIARELVFGLQSDLVSEDDGYWTLMPGHRRVGFDEAAGRALTEERHTLSPGARRVERIVRALTFARRAHPPGASGLE